MKERLTSRKIVHLTIVLAILLSLMTYRTWFSGPPSGEARATNDQICDLSHSSCSLLVGDQPLRAMLRTIVSLGTYLQAYST